MSKLSLIGAVRRAAPDLSERQRRAVVEEVLNTIGRQLLAERSFVLRELGTLVLHDKPARKGRNPGTGEAIAIEARTVVRFRPASGLSHRLRVEEARLSQASGRPL